MRFATAFETVVQEHAHLLGSLQPCKTAKLMPFSLGGGAIKVLGVALINHGCLPSLDPAMPRGSVVKPTAALPRNPTADCLADLALFSRPRSAPLVRPQGEDKQQHRKLGVAEASEWAVRFH